MTIYKEIKNFVVDFFYEQKKTKLKQSHIWKRKEAATYFRNINGIFEFNSLKTKNSWFFESTN